MYQIILYGLTYLPFFGKQVADEEEPSCYDSLAEFERMGVHSKIHGFLFN